MHAPGKHNVIIKRWKKTLTAKWGLGVFYSFCLGKHYENSKYLLGSVSLVRKSYFLISTLKIIVFPPEDGSAVSVRGCLYRELLFCTF